MEKAREAETLYWVFVPVMERSSKLVFPDQETGVVYDALYTCEGDHRQQMVEVQSKYLIEGWIHTMISSSRNGVAKAPTLMHWGTYLQQWAPFLIRLSAAKSAAVLEPSCGTRNHTGTTRYGTFPYGDGKERPLADTWYGETYGSMAKQLAMWFNMFQGIDLSSYHKMAAEALMGYLLSAPSESYLL